MEAKVGGQPGETGEKILTQPLPKVLDGIDQRIQIIEDAAKRAEKAAKVAEEIEDRLSKAEDALVKSIIKRLSRSEWVIILVVINLALIFVAVFFAVALVEGL